MDTREYLIEQARREGLEQGRERGLEQGREQGLEQGLKITEYTTKRSIAKAMQTMGFPPAVIAEATGLSEKEVREL